MHHSLFSPSGSCSISDMSVLSYDGGTDLPCQTVTSKITQITIWRRGSGAYTNCPAVLEFRQESGPNLVCGNLGGSDSLFGIIYLFSPQEHLLAVELCFQSVNNYNVVVYIKFYTNVGTHGPYGYSYCSGSAAFHVLRGFELVGMGVKYGTAIDRLRFHFDRCT